MNNPGELVFREDKGGLQEEAVREVVLGAFQQWNLAGRRVLVVIPDGTRTAPIPLFFRLIFEALNGKVKKLDYLVALGTHPAMSEAALNRLVGVDETERKGKYGRIGILSHGWDRPENLIQIGTISKDEASQLSRGMLPVEIPVRVNRLALEYDALVLCGPVFPHEVAGFSGGSKYILPGISGAETINFTHWLGALITSYEVIGVKNTPVRAVIERVREMVPTPKYGISFVVTHAAVPGVNAVDTHGVYAGRIPEAWSAAADLSAQIHVRYVERPFRKVISVIPRRYDDLWTGGKGMYKVEPAVAAGGEVILYAPHIQEVSYTHGKVIDEIGYHVRDYFVKQWERFNRYPWGVLAHSTHVRGIGVYEDEIERPRVKVTLATGIPAERCARINLDYLDPASIRLEEWKRREAEGILVVPDAGEILYRLRAGDFPPLPSGEGRGEG